MVSVTLKAQKVSLDLLSRLCVFHVLLQMHVESLQTGCGVCTWMCVSHLCSTVCVCHSQCASVGCLRSHAGCVLQEWIHTYKRMKEESDLRVCAGSVCP